MNQEFVALVESAAKARGAISIPRKFILQALEKIEAGEIDVERYPGTGAPSLKSVFEIAVKLYTEMQ